MLYALSAVAAAVMDVCERKHLTHGLHAIAWQTWQKQQKSYASLRDMWFGDVLGAAHYPPTFAKARMLAMKRSYMGLNGLNGLNWLDGVVNRTVAYFG